MKRRRLVLRCGLYLAVLTTGPAVSGVARAQSGASVNALAARVQRAEDIEEIKNVLITYGRSLDARDLNTYANLFAKDGEWVGGFGTVTGGPPAVLAFMQKNIGNGRGGSSYHVMSNFLIDVHGDTATAWSRWTFMSAGAENKPAVAQGGHYDDILVRENGHWKLKRRQAVREIPRRAEAPSTPAK
jgi:uncharacterized protein (TIGR02246 family)